MEPLNAVLLAMLVIGLGLLFVLRMRRRPERPERQEESVFVTAPGRSSGRAFFSDRLFGGIVAALLFGGIVFVMQVMGLGGPVGAILATPLAAFPTVENQLGPLFSSIAIVAVVAFAAGFAWPWLVHRIA